MQICKYKILFFIFFFSLGHLLAQNTTQITYKTNPATIPNPERGFYRHSETHAINYIPLVESDLLNYRLKSNNTLLVRVFYLEKFINCAIDQNYLNAMNTDFATIRKAGLKCIVRFAYSTKTSGVIDASKEQMLRHISQLKAIFESNNDVICLVQAGFIGAWGEWFYTSNFGIKPNDNDYANRKEVTAALLAAIPQNRMLQLRTPFFKQKMYTPNPVSKEQAYSGIDIARLGHFNDCFLSDDTDNGTYKDVITQYPYLEAETKYVVMGGETCDPNTIRTNCSVALSELNKFHWSFMNFDYNEKVIAKFKDNKCFDEINQRLGYRFEMTQGNFPNKLGLKDKLKFDLTLKNKGFATPFNKKEVTLILRNTTDKKVYPIDLNTDPRFWNTNEITTLSFNLDLPGNVTAGNYELLLHISDDDTRLKNRPEYAIQLANMGTWETRTGYNKLLHTIEITSSDLSNNVSQKEKENIVVNTFSQDQITIEIADVASYSIVFYNNVGQVLTVDKALENNDKMIINTQNIDNGVYLIEFKKDNHKEFKKITVSH
jgi:hypothetical protein